MPEQQPGLAADLAGRVYEDAPAYQVSREAIRDVVGDLLPESREP